MSSDLGETLTTRSDIAQPCGVAGDSRTSEAGRSGLSLTAARASASRAALLAVDDADDRRDVEPRAPGAPRPLRALPRRQVTTSSTRQTRSPGSKHALDLVRRCRGPSPRRARSRTEGRPRGRRPRRAGRRRVRAPRAGSPSGSNSCTADASAAPRAEAGRAASRTGTCRGSRSFAVPSVGGSPPPAGRRSGSPRRARRATRPSRRGARDSRAPGRAACSRSSEPSGSETIDPSSA